MDGPQHGLNIKIANSSPEGNFTCARACVCIAHVQPMTNIHACMQKINKESNNKQTKPFAKLPKLLWPPFKTKHVI